ncbi:MAG TPA: alpha/beta hydrolase, partial [Geomonas sp.]|nr:alpha/beta hydrolase [Geomonas sp.]
PYAATILQTPAAFKPQLPEKVPMKELVLEVIPDLERPELFFYDKGLRCTFAYQAQKAPLVFLIPGAGGSNKAPRMMTLMKALHQAGFHVIVLPSPTHPNFIISASQRHIPGDLTEDAADLYHAMETAWREVKDEVEVSDFYLAGFSLGGTESAFVAKLDEERKTFNFKKVLMVNPAVSLHSSIGQIEGLLDKVPGGKGQIIRFFNNTMDKFSRFYQRGQFVAFNDEFLYRVYQERLLTPEEAAGLIGVVYRLGSANMIFTSDVMTKGGYVVPRNRELSDTDSLTDYFRVSVHLSFFQYIDEYFYPSYQRLHPTVSREQLRETEGFKSIEGYLKSSGKFGVMTNQNDFILTPGDLDYLRQLFGDRVKIYPSGGHGGNFEYRDNVAYAVGFFK